MKSVGPHKNINSIILYNSQIDDYFIKLENKLEKIRTLEKTQKEIKNKTWDSNIKYRSSFDNSLTNLNSKFYLNRDKWADFIFSAGSFDDNRNNNKSINPFTFEEIFLIILEKALLLFWRDIASKLNPETIFKLQLKLHVVWTKDNNEEINKVDVNLTNINQSVYKISQIRSIGKIRIYSNKNFHEALLYMRASLSLSMDNYSEYFIKNIILTYNICSEDSVLNKNKIKIKLENLELLVASPSKNINEKNKIKLKIEDKTLPLTTDLTKWGKIQIIKGDYPYKFNFKETRLLINTDPNNNLYFKGAENFNYLVSIKGIKYKNKKIIIQRVSVTDKTFKLVHLNFIDINYDSKTPTTFVRLINNVQYVYVKGAKVLTQKRKKVNYFTNLKKCKNLTYNFITMDLETKSINGTLIPYCVSIFDGKKAYSFYITNYSSSEEMLKESVLAVLKRKYNENRVYLHNFSYFDGIFLMKIISSLVDTNKIKPVIRDGRIINLKVSFEPENRKTNKFNKRKYFVEFRDSYLLLTTSLEKLGKTFAINKGKLEKKLPFPYRFVNEKKISFNYVGLVPEFKFYDKISEIEYKELLDSMKSKGKDLTKWDLKKETIYYCEQDCRTLYYAIKEFSKLIYLQFGVDISKTPTISSLAFRVFRVKYLQAGDNISVLNGSIYDFIYRGYYGGAVDAYIPQGKNIKCYDVNSIYPAAMSTNKMPVGNPYYFEGDISYFNKVNFNYPLDSELNGDFKNKIPPKTIYSCLNEIFNNYNTSEFHKEIIKFLNLNNKFNVLSNKDNLPYGFFEVELETPPREEWNEPILLKKHKTLNGGVRTIAPVGNWKGVYFGEELFNAVSKNPKHKFKSFRGFLFRQKNVFKDYVENLFKLRISSPKNSPLNIIAKLLLNSLYGRFGMNPDKDNHIIISDRVEKDKIYIKNEVSNVIDFGNGKELFSFSPKKVNELEISDFFENEEAKPKAMINVAISASITGYSRIFMSQYKNNPLFKLYYSDTDSVFIDVDLNKVSPELVGELLGQWKLEYEFDKVVFLAPKVYGGVTSEGQEIVKAKGVKNIIPFKELETLLKKDAKLKIPSEKWYRDLSKGNIQVKQEIYNLAIYSTKRELIYNNEGKFINTKPFIINEKESS